MSYNLRKSTPGTLLADINEYEQIHGSRLFQQRLYETTQQNSKVQQVRRHLYYQVYTNIESWPIQQFTAPETLQQCTWLLYSISGIHFSNLNVLTLQRVGLDSLEPISWLNAPNLQSLNLNLNHFHSYKPLAKTNLPKLHSLRLQQNCVTNSTKICEALHMARMNPNKINKRNLGYAKFPWFKKSPDDFESFSNFSNEAYDIDTELFCIIKIQGMFCWNNRLKKIVGENWEHLKLYA